ncbi:MAG TPA: DUF86 domain-containing protein [Burkholderiales bacterium]|nr:DUF86 domain-containing protein [Burkholderiales bacterium]
MTGPDPRDPAYLDHMLEAIVRIRRYVGRKRRAGFLSDALLQDAVIRNIEIVGEAASRLSPGFTARHPEIPWRDIAGMRHRLIHGYLKVNLDTVWEVVERDLPALAPRLRALLGVPPASTVKRPVSKRRGPTPRSARGGRVPAKRRR